MENVVRAITADGSAVAAVIDATDLVAEMAEMHRTSPVATVALGRLSIGAALMGAMLKNKTHTVTLRVDGGGPLGYLLAVASGTGDVKSYLQHPTDQTMGEVAHAVGSSGTLSVSKDVGADLPTTGQVALVSGEIGEDLTSYYATSEQTPTVCGLGVTVASDGTVLFAGGFLVQLLPFADEGCIAVLEKNLASLPPIAKMLGEKMTPEDICNRLLEGLQPEVLDRGDAQYRCDCSKERVSRAIQSLPQAERQEMADKGETIEVTCHFCNQVYHLDPCTPR